MHRAYVVCLVVQRLLIKDISGRIWLEDRHHKYSDNLEKEIFLELLFSS